MRRLRLQGINLQLYDYAGLIERFLNREVTADEFQTLYFDHYLNEKVPMSEEAFESLDWLFAEVDSYTEVEDAIKNFPDHYITEERLRQSAEETLREIRELEKQGKMKE